MEIFVDPLNATSTDPNKDLLYFTRRMAAADGTVLEIPTGKPVTTLRKWRKQDIPLPTLKVSAPSSPVDYSTATDTAVSQINSTLSNPLVFVASQPSHGITMNYSPNFVFEGSTIEGQLAKDVSGNVLYPITYNVEIRVDPVGFMPRMVLTAKKELLRSILASGRDSIFTNHILYSGATQDISEHETRMFKILLNVPDNHDMSRYN